MDGWRGPTPMETVMVIIALLGEINFEKGLACGCGKIKVSIVRFKDLISRDEGLSRSMVRNKA